MEQLAQLTQLAYQYGPFLFALLFMLVISRWGYQIYQQACTREPPASQEEINTYRLYFIGSTGFGFSLVILALGWWFYHNDSPQQYVFKGEIRGLKDYERIASSSIYLRPRWVSSGLPDAPQLHNEEFLVVQERPFKAQSNFDVLFSKGPGNLEQLSLPYSEADYPIYQISWDDRQGKMRLQLISTEPSAQAFNWLRSAQAADSEPNAITRLPYAFPLLAESQNISVPKDPQQLETLLQAYTTPVSTKLLIIAELQTWDEAKLKSFLKRPGFSEPPLLSLLDLTRHTDKELAYKARQLLQMNAKEPYNWVNSILSEMLLSTDSFVQMQAESILQRIEAETALALISSLQKRLPSLSALGAEIRQNGTRVLYPTGTQEGDQYCVKITWPVANKEIANCLEEFLQNVTQEQASRREQTPGQHWIFSKTKSWAIWSAEQAEACQAQTRFIPWDK